VDINNLEKIGFGGGCHWCTEAVFQQVKGVHGVDQGFVSSYGVENNFSEGVIVLFDPSITPLIELIRIHLNTHSSTSTHKMRFKYRSAIYTFSNSQEQETNEILKSLNSKFPSEIITKILAFAEFKPSAEEFRNYYLKDPEKPFCRVYIEPKIKNIRKEFPDLIKK